jgi:uncharacterized protein YdbL (DUF1318 family)
MARIAIRGIARTAKLTLASILIGACVTINVYFPAAAAEKAADQIIDAVTGAGGGSKPGTQPRVAPITRNQLAQPSFLVAAIGNALYALIPAAQAQDANLDISSPEIRAITASMSARFPQLQKFFDSGVLGMTNDGLIQVHNTSAITLPERALVTRLIAEDNKDRETLYTEIARANNHPEWAGDIRKTFAKRWVEHGARAGWFYQNAAGAWATK